MGGKKNCQEGSYHRDISSPIFWKPPGLLKENRPSGTCHYSDSLPNLKGLRAPGRRKGGYRSEERLLRGALFLVEEKGKKVVRGGKAPSFRG